MHCCWGPSGTSVSAVLSLCLSSLWHLALWTWVSRLLETSTLSAQLRETVGSPLSSDSDRADAASWGNLRTCFIYYPCLRGNSLFIQISNVWKQGLFSHCIFGLYVSYFGQAGKSGPYNFIRSSDPYPGFYSDCILILFCHFITYVNIFRQDSLVLPIQKLLCIF